MHALPLKNDISETIQEKFERTEIKDFSGITKLYEQFDQYLYFENEKSKNFYIVPGDIPNHYLRTVVADAIDFPERANWESSTNVEWINLFKAKLKDIYEE